MPVSDNEIGTMEANARFRVNNDNFILSVVFTVYIVCWYKKYKIDYIYYIVTVPIFSFSLCVF